MKERKSGKIIILAILFVILFVVLISFLFFIVLGILSFTGTGVGEEDSAPFSDYQYYEYNPRTNETSFGIVTIPRDIHDYISYETEEHNQVLISPFGSSEYRCTGTCYCAQTSERRSVGAIPFSRGLVYLLTAASSVFAVRLAMEHFDEECKEGSTDGCPIDSIKSEVFECKNVHGEDFNAKDLESPRKYLCEGNCLKKKYRTSRAKELSRNFGCEKLQMDGEIIVDPKFLTIMGQDRNMEVGMLQTARYKFQEVLNPFCFKESLEDDIVDFMQNGKKFFMKKQMNLCVGMNKVGINPSIKCTRIDSEFDCAIPASD